MAATVNIGTAVQFVLLATSTVTNAGASVITNGDVGVIAGGSIVGITGDMLTDGAIASAAAAATAQADLAVAYSEVLSRTGASSSLPAELGGVTVTPGFYNNDGACSIATGVLTLNGEGTYVFRITAALAIAAAVGVVLTNGATEDNVFWTVGGAFAVGAGGTFYGTMIGHAAVAVGASCVIRGRRMMLAGALTMDTLIVIGPDMAALNEAKAVALTAALVATGTVQQSRIVELPDSTTATYAHTFGNSCDVAVRFVVEAAETALLPATVQWRLYADGNLVTSSNWEQVLQSESSILYILPAERGRPLTQSTWQRIAPSESRSDVTFLTKTERYTVPVNMRYCVRFCQRLSQELWGSTPGRQVWIDSNSEFVLPSARMSVVAVPVTVVYCTQPQFAEMQLVE